MTQAGPDDPCMYCEQTPRNGAWNQPCHESADHHHWTREQREHYHDQKLIATAQSLRRAALELDRIAAAIDELPARLRRKVLRAPALLSAYRLDPEIVRNEAERARDTLHVYGLLDV